jgi:polypeptide N-acetylgalactosaminyltransferase
MDGKLKTIFTSKCDESKKTQKWNWGFVNETMLRKWPDYGKPILDKIELEDLGTK